MGNIEILMGDIEIVETILRLCGVRYQERRDTSGRPFCFSSPRSNAGPHWHIFFSSDGSCRLYNLKDADSVVMFGKPCAACSDSWGR